jgi:hypothetical protein
MLHPRKYTLKVLNTWNCTETPELRKCKATPEEFKEVKSQKTEQDSLLTVALHSGLLSRTSMTLNDLFGLLRWHVCMTTPTQTKHRQNGRGVGKKFIWGEAVYNSHIY